MSIFNINTISFTKTKDDEEFEIWHKRTHTFICLLIRYETEIDVSMMYIILG